MNKSSNLHSTNNNSVALNNENELIKIPSFLNTLSYYDLAPKLIQTASQNNNQTFNTNIIKILELIQESLSIKNQALSQSLPQLKESNSLDLAQKSADLNHRKELQSLLIKALNQNDFIKANLINSFLNQTQAVNNTTAQLNNLIDSYNMNNSESINYRNQNTNDPLQLTTNNVCQEAGIEDRNLTVTDNITQPLIADKELTNQIEEESDDLEKSTNQINIMETSLNENSSSDDNGIVIDKSIKPKLRTGPMSPIRHLICSPGLEANAHKYKILILYKGACNGYCYAKKSWSKEVHLHYIVNTIYCNDHISRLVKKQGIQFYNSFVLQSPERWNQLIKLYRMEKVKQPQINK